jgi:probable F420-dependent oxidoreductase
VEAARPFRFGLNAVGGASGQAWQETARKAEAAGYSTLAVADHLYTQLAPLASLVAAADVTTTLRLSSYVFGNDFWHPAILARETATIDLLSGGRLELGIGTGWQRNDYEQRGMALATPGVRRRRLAEAIQVLKGLFGDGPFSFAGEHYRIEALDCQPKPIQRPHPPLLVGGGGPKMLALAAQEADIVSVNALTTPEGDIDGSSLTAQATDSKVGWVREAAGERFAEIELNMLVFAHISERREETAAQIAADWGFLAQGVSGADLLDSPTFLFGGVEQIAEDLLRRRERFGISYFTVFGEENLEAFAPVVARLSGA